MTGLWEQWCLEEEKNQLWRFWFCFFSQNTDLFFFFNVLPLPFISEGTIGILLNSSGAQWPFVQSEEIHLFLYWYAFNLGIIF